MAGEQLEVDTATTEQNSTGAAQSQVDNAAVNKDEDDDLAAGFEAKGAGEASEKPEAQPGAATPSAEAAGKPNQPSGEAAAAEPEYMRVTRADWEALTNRVASVDEVKRQMASVNGRMGDIAKRLETAGQAIEVTADDFPELQRDFPELVDAQVAGVNNALKKVRAGGGGISQEVLEREVAKATETARAGAVNLHLDDIVGGDWVAEVKTKEFQDFKAANAEVATLCASPEPRDAAKALRAWVAHKTKPATPAAPAARTSTRTQQLAASVTPRGSSAAPAARADNDDGFSEGFKTGQA